MFKKPAKLVLPPYPDPNEPGISGQERATRLIVKDRYKASESDARLLGKKITEKG